MIITGVQAVASHEFKSLVLLCLGGCHTEMCCNSGVTGRQFSSQLAGKGRIRCRSSDRWSAPETRRLTRLQITGRRLVTCSSGAVRAALPASPTCPRLGRAAQHYQQLLYQRQSGNAHSGGAEVQKEIKNETQGRRLTPSVKHRRWADSRREPAGSSAAPAWLIALSANVQTNTKISNTAT